MFWYGVAWQAALLPLRLSASMATREREIRATPDREGPAQLPERYGYMLDDGWGVIYDEENPSSAWIATTGDVLTLNRTPE